MFYNSNLVGCGLAAVISFGAACHTWGGFFEPFYAYRDPFRYLSWSYILAVIGMAIMFFVALFSFIDIIFVWRSMVTKRRKAAEAAKPAELHTARVVNASDLNRPVRVGPPPQQYTTQPPYPVHNPEEKILYPVHPYHPAHPEEKKVTFSDQIMNGLRRNNKEKFQKSHKVFETNDKDKSKKFYHQTYAMERET